VIAADTHDYAFAFLDEFAKKEIRRASLKALALPGHLVPYASREMPIARGFGTGGLQLTLSLIGEGDRLKMIDQGSDPSVNAVSLRNFICRMSPGVTGTTVTAEATVIQTRHRIPETPLGHGQIMVYQVPYPDSLVVVEAEEARRRQMHAECDYTRLYVKLYEDIVTFGEIRLSHRYPTRIDGRYVIDPSPIPRFDVPKLDHSPAVHLFGAGREKKIYAVPPYTAADPLAFEDVPFRVERFLDTDGHPERCRVCGSRHSFLEEFMTPDGASVYQCSDTEYCARHAAAGTPEHADGG